MLQREKKQTIPNQKKQFQTWSEGQSRAASLPRLGTRGRWLASPGQKIDTLFFFMDTLFWKMNETEN